MGHYTEVYVNVDLVEGVPSEVTDILELIETGQHDWSGLFRSGSYYTANTSCCKLLHDQGWSFIGKGDLKLGHQFDEFLKWLAPYVDYGIVDPMFIGYQRYESNVYPDMVFVGSDGLQFQSVSGMKIPMIKPLEDSLTFLGSCPHNSLDFDCPECKTERKEQ
jgi:hypothetical protein